MDADQWIIKMFSNREQSINCNYDMNDPEQESTEYVEEKEEKTTENDEEEEDRVSDVEDYMSENDGENEELDGEEEVENPFLDDGADDMFAAGIEDNEDFSDNEDDEKAKKPRKTKETKDSKKPKETKKAKKQKVEKKNEKTKVSQPKKAAPTKRKASDVAAEVTPSEPKPQAPPPAKKSKVDKDIDWDATLAHYAKRVQCLNLNELQNVYLSDFDLKEGQRHHASTLIQVAKSANVKIKGITSENKKNGKYLNSLPDNEKRLNEGGTARVVYIGKDNRFTGHTSTEFSLKKEDMIYK